MSADRPIRWLLLTLALLSAPALGQVLREAARDAVGRSGGERR